MSRSSLLSSYYNINNNAMLYTNIIHQQRRNYIFLPSSLSDAYSKLLKTLVDNSKTSNKRLKVKLQSRWQDTLFSLRERMDLLKKIQREQRKIARRRAHAAGNSMMKRVSANKYYSNIHGNVIAGKLSSSIALSKGKRNLMSHYNAKKRVYARRRMARLLARKKYALGGSSWIGSSSTGTSAKSPPPVGMISTTDNINSSGIIINNDDNNNTTWKGITLTEPAQQSWFDEEGCPLTSRDPTTGRFVNPWLSESSNGETGLKKFLRWKLGGAWCRFLEGVGISSEDDDIMGQKEMKRKQTWLGGAWCRFLEAAGISSEDNKILTKGKQTSNVGVYSLNDGENSQDSTPSDWSFPPSSGEPRSSSAIGKQFSPTRTTNDGQTKPQGTINLTWIGHSSTMVTFPGDFTILTDPHFSNYAGPVRRDVPPAFGVADLPDVITCSSYESVDYWSILELIDSNKVKLWIVPLGIKSWLMDQAGLSPENIVELEWWEGVRISKTPKVKNMSANETEMIHPEVEGLVRAFDKDKEETSHGMQDKNELVVTCAPAQHWCSRTPLDRNQRLWCSFAVHATPAKSQTITSQTHSFYFAGDTGLPPEFPLHHQIGDRLGPFDLSAIPIGAYEPEWFMRESHCNPAEAVRIHQAVRSRRSVAVHFDTFDLADEAREEPPRLLLNEVDRVNEENVKMATEVVAAADEVGIATGVEKIEVQLRKDEVMKDSHSSSSFDEQTAVSEVSGKLIEMLPPLIDFAVIKQGQSIDSSPR
ncbi:hypothetical protein ACHAXR_004317 [Thalassiosira sp. AJA248-18]